MHWRNSNFQILYFIVGNCKTPDEAYRVLCELREEREQALNSAKVGQIKKKIKILNAKKKIESEDEITRLEGEAELLDIELSEKIEKDCIRAAEQEVAYINKLIDDIQPLRKYKDYPDEEAHQLCQREEWKLRLIERARAMIASSGTIPYDHLITMMNHPDFNAEIYPEIVRITGGKDIPELQIDNPVLKLLENKK